MHIIQEGHILDEKQWSLLSLSSSTEEIKNATKSIPNNKSLGLDGYNSKFYKASWYVIGEDVVEAIQQFFRYGKLLQELNVTAIHLILKVPNPKDPSDYRPISCCHILYKCITKLLCSTLRLVLNSDIVPSQGAFVVGCSIMQNILLCQDILKQYGRKHYPLVTY